MSTLERVRPGVRTAGPENVELPAGYKIEPLVTNLNYPTSVSWDVDGNLLIAESTVPFGHVDPTEIRILRRSPDGTIDTVLGGLEQLINDITVYQGLLFVSQRGKISIVEDGRVRDLITGLPSWGLHQNNAIAFGPDGRMYFGQGTVSNAGVVDTYALDHLRRNQHLGAHDIPGAPVVLTGQRFETHDLATGETRPTGAFSAWGTATRPGQRIAGARPGQAASGAIMSANLNGSDLRVYAWGFRNPFGLAFGPDRRLYVTNNGANRVPPRPVTADPDTLWVVEEGVWYGWPDYYGGQPITDPAFTPPGGLPNAFLIANHDELLQGRQKPPAPLLSLGLHVAPGKFDFCLHPEFGFENQLFLAEFGAMLTPLEGLPMTGREGHRVVRIDLAQGTVTDFAVNRDRLPASLSHGQGGLERPIEAKFGPDGNLYIVDMGVLALQEQGWFAHAGTGIVWQVSRE